MIKEEKLVQFYFQQYKDCCRKYKRKNNEGKKNYEQRIRFLQAELRQMRPSRVTPVRLEDYHRQVRNLAYYAFKQDNKVAIMQLKDLLLPALVHLDVQKLRTDEREMVTAEFISFLRSEMPMRICTRNLSDLCHAYARFGIEKQIIDRVPERPEMEFPEAMEMERHFILHIGPTNCGKTYRALQCLQTAQQGVYLGPLRLLALEIYEKMNEEGTPCTMLTGEECIRQDDARVISSTIEMLDLGKQYDIAVIDEAQMISDPERGYCWTRAILGLRAKEIHICMSPAAEQVVTHLIELGNGTRERRVYERMTKLVCEEKSFEFPKDVCRGDALIAFSKKAVLDIAARLEQEGIKASVVYGSLPPDIRRRQIRHFINGRTRVVVSTDAIGMGLNLPVRRIVFIKTEKFDGTQVRPLLPSEVKQIAGRAGRYQMYDIGYINAMGDEELNYVKENYEKPDTQISHVTLGFPAVLLDMTEPLNAILRIWKSVEPSEPFEKIDISDILTLYDKAYEVRKEIDGFEEKHTLYRMLTCPVDVRNKELTSLWLHYCKTYSADVSLDFPRKEWIRERGLMRYEVYYQMLDLYHQFSNRMGKIIDFEALEEAREKTSDTIMYLLGKEKNDYIKRCRYCAKMLPLGSRTGICEECHREMYVYQE